MVYDEIPFKYTRCESEPLKAYGKVIGSNLKKPWEILGMEASFKSHVDDGAKVQGTEIDESEGPVWIGGGAEVIDSRINGPAWIGNESKIGPNALIRKGSIGKNCRVGQAVEVKNSVIQPNTKIPHLSYLGDSVIGSKVNLAAGTITSNLRHDESTVKVGLRDEKIDTGRRKLGAIVGDCVKTGIKTLIYEGRVLGPFSFTQPGAEVRHRLKPFKILGREENSTLRRKQLKTAFPSCKDKIDELWDELCVE